MTVREAVVIKEFPAKQAGELVGWAFAVPHEDELGVAGGVAYAKVGEDGAEIEVSGDHTKAHGLRDKVAVNFNVGINKGEIFELRPTQAPGAPWNEVFAQVPSSWFAYGLNRQPRAATGKWYRGSEAILHGIREQLADNQIRWLYSALYHTLALAANRESMLVDPAMYGVTNLEINGMMTYLGGLKEVQIADEQMKRDMSAYSAVPAYRVAEVYGETRERVKDFNAQMIARAEQATLGRFLLHHQISGGLDAEGPVSSLARKETEPAVDFLNAELEAVEKQVEKAAALLARLELLAKAESAKF